MDAAKSFAEYLMLSSTTKNIETLSQKAKTLANAALKTDGDLLAVAIAAPNLQLAPIAVVQFRDRIEHPVDANNHTYLFMYWRELGVAWNHTDGSEIWGTPFRDCGPMQGRWLWPYSVTLQAHGFRVVASSFIAADTDPCNDAMEAVFGKKHRYNISSQVKIIKHFEFFIFNFFFVLPLPHTNSLSCDPQTMFCFAAMPDETSSKSSYTCLCKEGFYVPNSTLQGFESSKIEEGSGNYRYEQAKLSHFSLSYQTAYFYFV